jgi:RNA polymerase sigma-70 factor (ECF subfamily)
VNRIGGSRRQGRREDGNPVSANDADDGALLRRVAEGDERALRALYDRHAGWLLVRLRRWCAAADTVDQALQDTFLAVWRHAGSYRGGGEVAAFIWGIAIRQLLTAMRAERRAAGRALGAVRLAADTTPVDPAVASAEEVVLLAIEHGPLGDVLARLSPELRAALQATVLDGLTCAEAGRLLGIPAGTVKSRCHRARIELREALA